MVRLYGETLYNLYTLYTLYDTILPIIFSWYSLNCIIYVIHYFKFKLNELLFTQCFSYSMNEKIAFMDGRKISFKKAWP